MLLAQLITNRERSLLLRLWLFVHMWKSLSAKSMHWTGDLSIIILISVLQLHFISLTGFTVRKSWSWFEYCQECFLLDSSAYVLVHLDWIGWLLWYRCRTGSYIVLAGSIYDDWSKNTDSRNFLWLLCLLGSIVRLWMLRLDKRCITKLRGN